MLFVFFLLSNWVECKSTLLIAERINRSNSNRYNSMFDILKSINNNCMCGIVARLEIESFNK